MFTPPEIASARIRYNQIQREKQHRKSFKGGSIANNTFVWTRHDYIWDKYNKFELRAIINRATYKTYSESEIDSCRRFLERKFPTEIPNNDPTFTKNYPRSYGLYRKPDEISANRISTQILGNDCDIGMYGNVDNPTTHDVFLNKEFLWILWFHMKHIRFWINEETYGNKNIYNSTKSIGLLNSLINYYDSIVTSYMYWCSMIVININIYESSKRLSINDKGRYDLLCETEKALQQSIYLMNTFILNIFLLIILYMFN
jgi:hypothetical protein